MRKLILSVTITICAAVLFVACSKEEERIENRKEQEGEKQGKSDAVGELQISLTTSKLSLWLTNNNQKHKATFRITKGSGSYRLNITPADVVAAKLKENSEVEVVALKDGKATIQLTDEKWNKMQSISVEVIVPKKLEINPSAVNMIVGQQQTLTIATGNGEYDITLPADVSKKLTATLSKDSKSILLKAGEEKVKTILTVTDRITEEKVTVSVVVRSKPELSVSSLSLLKPYKDESYTPKQIYEFIKKHKTEYEKQIKMLEALPPHNYSTQKKIWEESKKLGESYYKTKIKKTTEQSGLDVLWDLYYDGYTFGVGYAYIEYLARKTAQFQKNYPDNEKIKQLASTMFEEGYTSLEGNPFLKHINDRVIANYNKLITLYNRLEKE